MSVDDILTIKLNPNDNVATAFKNISKGETTQNIKAENNIPKGKSKPRSGNLERKSKPRRGDPTKRLKKQNERN